MALTQEQLDQLAFCEAGAAPQRQHDIFMNTRQVRLEAIRIAKETLIENARSKSVDERDIAASDITNFADTIVSYVTTE